jgi:predicted dinucleotide-binding enzyme
MSSISIIGVGSMASALVGRALAGGNTVEIIGRDPAKAKALAAALGGATERLDDMRAGGGGLRDLLRAYTHSTYLTRTITCAF